MKKLFSILAVVLCANSFTNETTWEQHYQAAFESLLDGNHKMMARYLTEYPIAYQDPLGDNVYLYAGFKPPKQKYSHKAKNFVRAFKSANLAKHGRTFNPKKAKIRSECERYPHTLLLQYIDPQRQRNDPRRIVEVVSYHYNLSECVKKRSYLQDQLDLGRFRNKKIIIDTNSFWNFNGKYFSLYLGHQNI